MRRHRIRYQRYTPCISNILFFIASLNAPIKNNYVRLSLMVLHCVHLCLVGAGGLLLRGADSSWRFICPSKVQNMRWQRSSARQGRLKYSLTRFHEDLRSQSFGVISGVSRVRGYSHETCQSVLPKHHAVATKCLQTKRVTAQL